MTKLYTEGKATIEVLKSIAYTFASEVKSMHFLLVNELTENLDVHMGKK